MSIIETNDPSHHLGDDVKDVSCFGWYARARQLYNIGLKPTAAAWLMMDLITIQSCPPLVLKEKERPITPNAIPSQRLSTAIWLSGKASRLENPVNLVWSPPPRQNWTVRFLPEPPWGLSYPGELRGILHTINDENCDVVKKMTCISFLHGEVASTIKSLAWNLKS